MAQIGLLISKRFLAGNPATRPLGTLWCKHHRQDADCTEAVSESIAFVVTEEIKNEKTVPVPAQADF